MKYEWYYYNNFFTLNECKEISNLMQTTPSTGIDVPAERVTKTSDVGVVSWEKSKHLLWKLEHAARYINQQMFGLELWEMTDFDFANYNRYEGYKQGKYDWHKDFMLNEIYDLKLTVVANVSTTPYQGGGFELFLNEPVHIKELDTPGSVLIFPSIFHHRVLPVTSGTRETVSLWIKGPNFR